MLNCQKTRTDNKIRYSYTFQIVNQLKLLDITWGGGHLIVLSDSALAKLSTGYVKRAQAHTSINEPSLRFKLFMNTCK